jgi:hypothetical protein
MQNLTQRYQAVFISTKRNIMKEIDKIEFLWTKKLIYLNIFNYQIRVIGR